MKLALGLPLSPFLDSDFSLLRGTLKGARWAELQENFLFLSSLGNITSRSILDEIDYEFSRLSWTPFNIHLQHVYHRLGRNCDRLTTEPAQNDDLNDLCREIDKHLRAASCPPPRQRIKPEAAFGFLEPDREEDIIPWIQRHNLFRSQPLLVDRLILIEVLGKNDDFSYRTLESYGCYGQAFPLPAYDEHL